MLFDTIVNVLIEHAIGINFITRALARVLIAKFLNHVLDFPFNYTNRTIDTATKQLAK